MQLLANGKQQFIDGSGAPLASGKVYFYAPATLTPATTYQDAAGTIPNTNPVNLDSLGQAVIWGNGTYRQVVKDVAGNQVWDQIVSTPDLNAPMVNLSAASGAALVGYQSSLPGAAPTTVKARFDSLDGSKVRFATGFFASGSNANNLGQGLQIGGGDVTYGSDGSFLAPDGHASWLRMQPSKNESPMELVVYPSASQGQATATSGTSTITRVSGTPFSSAWIGRKLYFGPAVYRVLTVVDADHLTVSNVLGGTVPFASTFSETFHVAYISGAGTCTVTGGVVTRTTGDPFIPFITSPYVFKLNGAAYTVSAFTDVNTQTLGVPPANGSYSYTFEVDINDQLSTFRVQKLYGSSEENLSIYANYSGYHLRSFFSGFGKLRPIFIGNSTFSNIVAYADGSTSLGAEQGGEAVRILPSVGTPVNRLEVQAAATGFTPTWRARGLDANVGLGFDVQGTGVVSFTSNTSKTEFQIFGVGGSSWLGVQSDNSAQPTLSANGAATDIDVKLAPKGNGRVWLGAQIASGDVAINGYILVKDNAGVTRKLATIA